MHACCLWDVDVYSKEYIIDVCLCVYNSHVGFKLHVRSKCCKLIINKQIDDRHMTCHVNMYTYTLVSHFYQIK